MQRLRNAKVKKKACLWEMTCNSQKHLGKVLVEQCQKIRLEQYKGVRSWKASYEGGHVIYGLNRVTFESEREPEKQL